MRGHSSSLMPPSFPLSPKNVFALFSPPSFPPSLLPSEPLLSAPLFIHASAVFCMGALSSPGDRQFEREGVGIGPNMHIFGPASGASLVLLRAFHGTNGKKQLNRINVGDIFQRLSFVSAFLGGCARTARRRRGRRARLYHVVSLSG